VVTEADICPECGVPSYITDEHVWLESGIIIHKRMQANRMVFIESEYLDPLFHGIGDIMDMPIVEAVITAKRRATKGYLGHVMSDDVKSLLKEREISWVPIYDGFQRIGHVMGFGRHEVKGYRYEGGENDYVTETVSEPYSVALACGDMIGVFEILFGCELGGSYRKLSPDVYEMVGFVSSHPPEFRKRLHFKQYEHGKGDIRLERCASCGGPLTLSDYRWFLDRGVIANTSSGTRVVMTGTELDVIFEELERQMGEALPRAIVEAQRRYIRSGFYDIKILGRLGLREQLALRGLGCLRELETGEKGLSMRLDNAVLHLIVVGIVQGLYEQAWDIDSRVDWEYSEDGVLHIEVIPKPNRLR
jgi:hypothetical protein